MRVAINSIHARVLPNVAPHIHQIPLQKIKTLFTDEWMVNFICTTSDSPAQAGFFFRPFSFLLERVGVAWDALT